MGDGNRFQLRLLGGFRLEQDGRVLPIPHSARRLVAFLGIRGRSARTEIAGTLWPDHPEPKAMACLRTALWRLHRLVTTPLVDGREMLAATTTVEVDVQAFVIAARRVTNANGSVDVSMTPGRFVVGELLPGWYEDWVLQEQQRMRQLQLHALEAIAERLAAAGRYSEAIEAALAAVRLEPLRESSYRALIVAHLAENNLVEAVRCFEAFQDTLANELGVRPSPELAALVQTRLARHALPIRPR